MPAQYGRVPSMPFPPQNPSYPVPGYVGQPVPGNWQPAPVSAPAPRMPVAAAMAAGIANPSAAPRPTIRLQAPDTLLVQPPAPVVLASPESLGVRVSPPQPAAVAPLDWNNAHARLERLGALGFHLDRLVQGDVRVTFMLPAGDRRAHQIEVVAGSEAAAVSAALESAEAWTLGRK